ncbi:DNA polymerase III subunit delta' [Acidithiobacillus sp. AMEEHan]|uniref:DNA polymerase III subunit delta' n=1 Tax=Acidithiobacillus sp. AMEEHan TaxID=2994951 RepID=UPI0027E46CB0|nr:DNA polymerase III subunit delta' [Acidithiobacillus sp. AMEEHan]
MNDVLLSDCTPPAWLAADRARALPQSLLLEAASDSLAAAWSERLVRLWLCHRPGAEACGTCPSCRLLDAGNHPDYLNLQASHGKTLGIEPIREGLEILAYTPQSGSLRVLRIVDAEKMSVAAANALLKGLEEPPQRARILLLSAAPVRLLPTIRSRCQRLESPPCEAYACARYLRAQGVDGADVDTLAQRYADRPAWALELVNSGLWPELQAAQAQLLSDTPRLELLWALVEQWSKDEERVLLLRDLMLGLYAQIFRLQLGLEAPLGARALSTRAASWSPAQLWQECQAWLRLVVDLRQNLQMPMRLERLLWRWFWGEREE